MIQNYIFSKMVILTFHTSLLIIKNLNHYKSLKIFTEFTELMKRKRLRMEDLLNLKMKKHGDLV
jgi:hypothetical protein